MMLFVNGESSLELKRSSPPPADDLPSLDSVLISWSVIEEEVGRWIHVHYRHFSSVDFWQDDHRLGVKRKGGVFGLILDKVSCSNEWSCLCCVGNRNPSI